MGYDRGNERGTRHHSPGDAGVAEDIVGDGGDSDPHDWLIQLPQPHRAADAAGPWRRDSGRRGDLERHLHRVDLVRRGLRVPGMGPHRR